MSPPSSPADRAGKWLLDRSSVVARIAGWAAAALVVAPLLYHLLRGSKAYLGLFEDDYFYYAIVADKLVSLGKLTYDGATLTNGFHPLWFLVVLALRATCGPFGTAFYVGLAVVFAAAMVATYEVSRSLARALGASPPMALAAALVPCVATFGIMSSGMETAIDVPLLMWLLREIARDSPLTGRRAAKLGFVASLAVLARLDIALLVALAGVGWIALARPGLSRAARVVGAFCAGGAAVPMYAAFNVLVCRSLLPVSALAKQLVKRPGINLRYLMAPAFGSPYGRATALLLVMGTIAAFLLWRRRTTAPIRPAALFAAAVCLAFTAVFYFVNALSGWIFFGWYAYPLAPAVLVSLILAGHVVAPRIAPRARGRASAVAFGAAVALCATQTVTYFVVHGPLWSVDDNGLLAMSIELSHRLQDRKGVYGMGAIGGFATYLVGQPFVQLEGLAADRAMIEHIRAEHDLADVLPAYHVDYLVLSFNLIGVEEHDGCYRLTQPHVEWAGRRVAKMHGTVCAEPIVHFETHLHRNSWSEFSDLDTYVFDVRDASAFRKDPTNSATDLSSSL